MAKKNKSEANSTKNFIVDELITNLGFDNKNIVTDITLDNFGITSPEFRQKKPDILISKKSQDNPIEFINNVLFYCEAKDTSAVVNDSDWLDAIQQGIVKAKALNQPYFGVTNFKTTHIYNADLANYINLTTLSNKKSFDPALISVNGNVIDYFPNFTELETIQTEFKKANDSKQLNLVFSNNQSLFAESHLKKVLLELNEIFRDMVFDDSNKIDFTIGLITLKMAEEKYKNVDLTQKFNGGYSKLYISKWWSNLDKNNIKNELNAYIEQLKSAKEFEDFSHSIVQVQNIINQSANNENKIAQIYQIITKVGDLHDAKFDVFGTTYEEYATESEKKKFGEYFTRRNYTRVLCELLFSKVNAFDPNKKFTVLDPTCGTGGFLTESFRVLREKFKQSGTYTKEAENYLRKQCLFGTDIKPENVGRTKLNMFMIGDGHSNIARCDSLNYDEFIKQFDGMDKVDFIVANPPYGGGATMPLVPQYINGVKQDKLVPLTDKINTERKELIFLYKIIDVLKPGGSACVVIPDGILENDSLAIAREELLKKAEFNAVVSLPLHAFAPYTLEKTYALILTKRPTPVNDLKDVANEKSWLYIIDYDGYANSNKRFPTKHKNKDGKWLHDELSSWTDTTGKQQKSILEERYNYSYTDDTLTTLIGIDGKVKKVRKGMVVSMNEIVHSCKISGYNENKNDSFILMPEFYMRKNAIRDKYDISTGQYGLKEVFDFHKQKANKNVNGIKVNLNLTEERIYQLIVDRINNDIQDSCPVFSGATEKDGVVGEIPRPNFNYQNLILQNSRFEFRFIDKDGGEILTDSNIHIESNKLGVSPDELFNECLKKHNGIIIHNDISYVINNTGVITIVGDGKAGYMFHRTPEQYPCFAMTISCIVGIPKKSVDLKDFIERYNEPFINIENGSGVRHFTDEKIRKIRVNI